MNIEFDGSKILSEADFHSAIVKAFGLSHYYGRNLDALWDVLSTDIERPIKVEWKYSETSRAAMGATFDQIVAILRKVEQTDLRYGHEERFELHLS